MHTCATVGVYSALPVCLCVHGGVCTAQFKCFIWANCPSCPYLGSCKEPTVQRLCHVHKKTPPTPPSSKHTPATGMITSRLHLIECSTLRAGVMGRSSQRGILMRDSMTLFFFFFLIQNSLKISVVRDAWQTLLKAHSKASYIFRSSLNYKLLMLCPLPSEICFPGGCISPWIILVSDKSKMCF